MYFTAQVPFLSSEVTAPISVIENFKGLRSADHLWQLTAKTDSTVLKEKNDKKRVGHFIWKCFSILMIIDHETVLIKYHYIITNFNKQR